MYGSLLQGGLRFGSGRWERIQELFDATAALDSDAQARYLVQAVQIARTTPYIGGLMVWNLNYQVAVPQTDEKWGFSVLKSDWSPRPAYSALVAMPKS